MSDNRSPNGHSPTDGPNGRIPSEPEYIILDALPHEEERKKRPFEDLNFVSAIHVSWKARLIFLLLAGVCAMWFMGSVICWAFSSLFYLLSAYRYEPFNQWMWRFWEGMVRAFVFTIGLMVASLSPPLGLGFIMLYFALYEEEGIMTQMFRTNLSKFTDEG